MAKRFDNPVLYPQPNDYYSCTLVEADPYIVVKAENGQNIITHLAGAYNFENIAVALCVGKYFNVSAEKANQAIANYQVGNMRSQIIEIGNNRIILDAYNANPSSMQAAIENLKAMDAPYKVVVLGDMFELEDEAEEEHKHLGQLIADGSFNEIWLCGKLMATAFKEAPTAHYFETREALQEKLKNKNFNNATILIKASRGIGLEKITEYIK
jgi:UDP-N-acetylmuramoyl-tripeptide--D-alanyl-D-alanine ligase